MKKFATLACLLIFLSACDPGEIKALAGNMDDNRVWVFIQLNVPEEGDKIDSYWYFARVPKLLYEKVADNSLTEGFILMEEVKYWGDGSKIYEYRDKENSGTLVFRIEDIRKINLLNEAPVTTGNNNETSADETDNDERSAEEKSEENPEASTEESPEESAEDSDSVEQNSTEDQTQSNDTNV